MVMAGMPVGLVAAVMDYVAAIDVGPIVGLAVAFGTLGSCD